MDVLPKYYSGWLKPNTKNYILYDTIYNNKMHRPSEYTEIKYRSLVAWDWGWEQGRNAMNSKEFEGLWIYFKPDWGDSCTTL